MQKPLKQLGIFWLISKAFESELSHEKPPVFSSVADKCPASMLPNPRGTVGREEQAMGKLNVDNKQVK